MGPGPKHKKYMHSKTQTSPRFRTGVQRENPHLTPTHGQVDYRLKKGGHLQTLRPEGRVINTDTFNYIKTQDCCSAT